MVFLPTSSLSESFAWWLMKRSIRLQFPSVPEISTQALADWLATKERMKPLILDTRTLEEYEVSHLYGATHSSSVESALKVLATVDKGHPVVAYCSVGYRSAKMAKKLREAGFSQVYNLEGSIFEWVNAGRAIYRGEKRVHVVHPYDKMWGTLLNQQYHAKLSD